MVIRHAQSTIHTLRREVSLVDVKPQPAVLRRTLNQFFDVQIQLAENAAQARVGTTYTECSHSTIPLRHSLHSGIVSITPTSSPPDSATKYRPVRRLAKQRPHAAADGVAFQPQRFRFRRHGDLKINDSRPIARPSGAQTRTAASTGGRIAFLPLGDVDVDLQCIAVFDQQPHHLPVVFQAADRVGQDPLR